MVTGCSLLDCEFVARQNGKLLPCARLVVENERLRELVRHLRECTKHNTCALCDYAEDTCDFDYDMRELGVNA